MCKKKVILSLFLIFYCQIVYSLNDTYVYILTYGARGVVVYCGITNDPEARALEHATDGTMGYNTFDTMIVVAGPMTRDRAYREETRYIHRHPIPSLYQTYPRDARAIEEYESRFDVSRLIQTPNPRVEYAPGVQRGV